MDRRLFAIYSWDETQETRGRTRGEVHLSLFLLCLNRFGCLMEQCFFSAPNFPFCAKFKIMNNTSPFVNPFICWPTLPIPHNMYVRLYCSCLRLIFDYLPPLDPAAPTIQQRSTTHPCQDRKILNNYSIIKRPSASIVY